MFITVSWCNSETVPKGKVCKSKAETINYLQKNYGGAYLQILLPQTFVDTSRNNFPIRTSFDGRAVCPISSQFQGI